jgi:hypothetical protein
MEMTPVSRGANVLKAASERSKDPEEQDGQVSVTRAVTVLPPEVMRTDLPHMEVPPIWGAFIATIMSLLLKGVPQDPREPVNQVALPEKPWAETIRLSGLSEGVGEVILVAVVWRTGVVSMGAAETMAARATAARRVSLLKTAILKV